MFLGDGFRWCRNCQALILHESHGLFGDPAPTSGLSFLPGACPAGQQHDVTGSGAYSLTTSGPWRVCRFCRQVYMPLPVVPPVGSPQLLSPDSSVPYGQVTSPSASPSPEPLPWATAGGSAQGHLCPAAAGNGFHAPAFKDYSPFDNPSRPRDELGLAPASSGTVATPYQTFQEGWNECANCSALFYSGGTGRGGVCAATGKNHVARRDEAYASGSEILARLPLGRAIQAGKKLELKVQAPTDIFTSLGEGEWKIASERQLWVESTWGQPSWTFNIAMLQGRLAFLEFDLSQLIATIHDPVLLALLPVLSLIDIPLSAVKFSSKTANYFPLCTNPEDFDPTASQVEWDNGKNNNGLALDFPMGSHVWRLWPKREDRIRFDMQDPKSGTTYSLEFDTEE